MSTDMQIDAAILNTTDLRLHARHNHAPNNKLTKLGGGEGRGLTPSIAITIITPPSRSIVYCAKRCQVDRRERAPAILEALLQ